jgi:hypothetical protein
MQPTSFETVEISWTHKLILLIAYSSAFYIYCKLLHRFPLNIISFGWFVTYTLFVYRMGERLENYLDP